MAKFKINGVVYQVEIDIKSGDWFVVTEKDEKILEKVNCGKEIDTALLFVLKDYIIS